MSDYEALLNRSWDDIPEPKLLPAGGWLVRGSTAALVRPREDADDQSMRVLLTYKAKSPVSVAPDLLDDMGDYDFEINDLTKEFWIKSAADWNEVRKHLAIHGIEMNGAILDANGKLGFAKAFKNAEVVAEVGQNFFTKRDGSSGSKNTLAKFQAVTD